MSIAADFSIDSDNRIVRHSAGATVYTVNDLYSYLQDYFDELTAMTVEVPMSAQTPTEYSLINGWFIPEDSYKYLQSGAVKTLGWDTAVYDNGVMIVKLDLLGYVACVPSDIGEEVSDGVDSGILLDYNNTLRKWWIRKTSASALSGAISVLAGTGTGTVTTNVSGENTYSNVYTLGAIDPLLTNVLYLEQVNPELTNNQITQYWPSGHIDIIVKVKEANTLIDNGYIRVFLREYTDLYSHFQILLASGGRNPVPLGTSSDTNNQTASATVSGWNDVTITFGAIMRDLNDGSGPHPYDVEISCGSRATLQEVYQRLKLVTARASGFTLNGYPGQFYRNANNSYPEVVVSPFGTYAGGRFFGATGVFLTNVPAIDSNSFTLIDSTGGSYEPPYTAAGTLLFNSYLAADGANSMYRLFYKQINVNGLSAAFGQTNAVTVQTSTGTEVTGTLAGNLTQVSYLYDFSGNTQAVWTANTTYYAGDFYRYGANWYVVMTNYTSAGTYGVADSTNNSAVSGPDVILVAVGLANAQYVEVAGNIIKSLTNSISAVGSLEQNYLNVV